ncbi:precursor of CEP7-like [Vigna umbellata]|uniref:precursor of CEP7-like n=1 Tax=Vigna umbellata TaxID=87088 RepID=UPI001F5FAC16|nr:precursor of CEP7-like [Vigna umbellata]
MAHLARTTCFLFVLLFLSWELLCIEGRSLKATRTTKSPKSVSSVKAMSTAINTTKGVVAKPSQLESIAKSLNGYVEAFRPTTPGHSPGVGHSINN